MTKKKGKLPEKKYLKTKVNTTVPEIKLHECNNIIIFQRDHILAMLISIIKNIKKLHHVLCP